MIDTLGAAKPPQEGLRSEAGVDSLHESAKQKAHRAAKMMEGLFLRQLMKTMRKSAPSSGVLGGGFGSKIYQEMQDSALADAMSEGGGIGLAATLGQAFGLDDHRPLPVTAAAARFVTPSRALQRFQAVAVQHRDLQNSVDEKNLYPEQRGSTPIAADNSSSPEGKKKRDLPRFMLAGATFEPPRRPEAIRLTDEDKRLHSPLSGVTLQEKSENTKLIGRPGQDARAAASGEIIEATSNRLVIAHENGQRTTYQRLARVWAQVGDLVLRGQTIGALGEEGVLDFSIEH